MPSDNGSADYVQPTPKSAEQIRTEAEAQIEALRVRREEYDRTRAQFGKSLQQDRHTATTSPSVRQREQELEFEFIVRIKTFGIRTQCEAPVTEGLWTVLHRAFGVDKVTLLDAERRTIQFDPLAHDGEHEGHDTSIIRGDQ